MSTKTRVTAAAAALFLLGCGGHPEQRTETHSSVGGGSPAAASTPLARTLPDSPPLVAGPSLQLDEGTFALTDAAGAKLIALDSARVPTQIRSAVCVGARVLPVSYDRHQAGQPDSAHGRATAATFGYLTGHVYRVTTGSAPTDATCYLSSDSVLIAAVVPAGSAAPGGCDATLASSLAAARGRSVLKCWPLAAIGPHVTVAAVQFANRDTSALASIVVVDHGQFLFEDFPATYRGPDNDVWRVDDGGKFSPEGFQVLFFARVRGIDIMGLTWAGSEGENAYLLVADSASAFRTVAHTYRYWVPE